ncbi:MAG: SDR family NAD(P)-dependent oxidoreductase, partial [Deltaproteobacteria bacterium]
MRTWNIDLSGKVALVTGGSRGLGKAIALAMAEKGASIAVCGRKQENLDKALAEFKATGAEVLAQPANMGKSDQAASLFKAIEGKFGR